ncbi:MAG: hypothetical protein WD510_03335 [Balneolaceae bacterium]
MLISTDIHSFFVLLLAMITLGATFFSAYSILNVVRLRNVRLSWKAGKIGGYPLFATLFLCSTLVLGGIVYHNGYTQYYPIVAGYGWIGFNWFLASYLASKRFITDNGIVKNINDPSQTVAWHQMTDYVEKKNDRNSEFVFIYQNRHPDQRRENTCIRLELNIPSHKLEDFKKIVSYKLGKSMSPNSELIFNVGAFD